MIDFKNPETATPNALTLIALIILVGTLVFMLVNKQPQAAILSTGHALERRQTNEQIVKAKEKGQELRTALAPKFWQGGSVEVTANILSKLTNEANKYGLTLTSFRPESQKNFTSFSELQYTVQVSGPYPQVRSLLTSLDGGNDKVALGSVQIAASPNAANGVQATIGISAYLLTDQTLLPATGGASHA